MFTEFRLVRLQSFILEGEGRFSLRPVLGDVRRGVLQKIWITWRRYSRSECDHVVAVVRTGYYCIT